MVVVLGLRTAGLSLSWLISALERLCAKEDRTWKERLFNQTKLVSHFFCTLSLEEEERQIADKNDVL